MTVRRIRRSIAAVASVAGAVALLVLSVAGASAGSDRAASASPPATADGAGLSHASGNPSLTNWPEFGLNPQRSDATDESTGITAGNIGQLHLRRVELPGTADNSAIFLSGVSVEGTVQNAVFVTTTYGITLAISPASGQILWQFTPPGIAGWDGTYQFTTASPIADPSGKYIYATSPNGLVHKLSVENGQEAPGWPVRITVLPAREKLTASLNIAGGELLATTGGYIGDQPPYVGHIVAINLASGNVDAVFNTLCADRRTIIDPSSCPASDSAILSRSGPVVLPNGKRVLIATGNALWNGTTEFGDSLIELTLPALRLVQAYAPTDQATLNTSDTDEGSGSPAVLPGHLALIGGKDGLLRVLNLHRLDGRRHPLPSQTGGQLQLLPTPGGAELWSAPAVWHSMVFVATGGGTTAYYVAHRGLHPAWSNSNHGTSPILAGGLLYVYDMDDGGLNVYGPHSGKLLRTLACGSGHWNSPIVVDGYVIEPEGDANSDSRSGVLDIWSLS